MLDRPQQPIANIALEQSLVGSVIVNPDTFRFAENIITADDFYEPIHREVWRLIADAHAAGRKTDLRLLIAALGETANQGLLGKGQSELTVKAYLARVCTEAALPMGVPDYAQAVRDLSDQRRIAALGAALWRDRPEDPDKLAIDAIDALDHIVGARSRSHSPRVTAGGAMAAAVDATAAAYQNDGVPTGIPWMIDELDHKTLGMQPGELLILAGRPGMGKFLPVNVPVLTPAGWRPIGEIKTGDTVVSVDGSHCKVSGVFPQGMKKISRIHFADGRSILAGDEHLWEVHSKHWDAPRVVDTAEIARRLQLVRFKKWLHIPLYSGNGHGSSDPPIPPYTLGAWIGDGSKSSGRITKPYEELFQRIGKDGFKISERVGKRGTRTILGLSVMLQDIGISELNSFERYIPSIYAECKFSDRVALLQGLLDTDGTVERDGTIRYSTTSRQLAIDVQALVWSIGGTCKIRNRTSQFTLRGIKKSGRPSFVLTVRHPRPCDLITLPHKRARLSKDYQYKNLKLRIDSVESAGKTSCVCISVDHPRGLYVAEQFIVTHNSAVAISCCRQIAKRDYKTLLVSLEMSAAPIGHRLISDELYDGEHHIAYHRLRSGKVDPNEFEQITRAALRIKDIPLTIEQRGGLTFSQIASMARRMKRRDGLDLIVVDHLQLIQASQRYAGQRVREVGEATAGGKMLAKELGIPVLMLCQLSRGIEGRADKRPFLSDLRESGEIEQDADVVVFVYRESYYLQNAEPKAGTEEHIKWLDAMEKAHNKCELIVAKQRNGPTGAVQIFLSVADNAVRNIAATDRLPLDFDKME